MKNIHYFILVLLTTSTFAQSALYNSGSIRIHDTATLGFHTNLINNATFDQNLGTVGFYGPTVTSVSGAFIPVFYDIEIFKPLSAVVLETSIDVINALNFIDGDIQTYRNNPIENMIVSPDAFTTGESDLSKVDGYLSIKQKQNFFFTVGDASYIRPLTLNSESENPEAKCAYFYEDPNIPTTKHQL